jgi:hypothetical protein
MTSRVCTDSPWPLFCGDLHQAQSWVWQRLQRRDHNAAQTAHWALSLGLQGPLQAWLERSSAPAIHGPWRGVHFRLARSQGAPWSHRYLFDTVSWQDIQQRWQSLQRGQGPIRIALQGGIGDHLQDLSCLIPWARQLDRPVILHVNRQRWEQFAALLQHSAPDLHVSSERFAKTDGLHVLELIALLGATQMQAEAWIPIPHGAPSSQRLVCCWTALGTNDRFSAWSRSVPFTAVMQLYTALLTRGWAANSIVDVSAWRPWEAEQLRSLGLRLINPAAGDVLTLAKAVAGSQRVLSIDTALTHLCAALGKRVHLLLPRFRDERWRELLDPRSSYARYCLVRAQRRFGCWEGELSWLRQQLS